MLLEKKRKTHKTPKKLDAMGQTEKLNNIESGSTTDEIEVTSKDVSVDNESQEYQDSPTTILLREMDDNSLSRKQWICRKGEDHRDIEALDQLMLKYGLENAKAHFLWVYDQIQAARKRGEDPLKSVVLDTCFMGKPKIGKTMVADLYEKLLQDLDLVRDGNRQKITYTNTYGTCSGWHTPTIVNEEPQDRGILYIYDMIDDDNWPSKIESLVERFNGPNPILIMEVNGKFEDSEKFLPGESSKLPRPHVIALGYSEDELSKILLAMVKKECGEKGIEGGWAGSFVRKFVSRSIKKAGPKSLPSVFESLDSLKSRRSARKNLEEHGRAPKTPEDIFFTKSDMLGLSDVEIGYRSKAWGELQEMVGMEKVKEAIRQLLCMVALNDRFSLEGRPPMETSFNRRCFIGPPGTGKTTAAGLYGKILVDLGLVGKNKIITKRASDLIGRYVGWSEEATKDALNEARNGVLIIDDFHLLFPDTMHNTGRTDVFRAAIIDTLVANIDPNSTRKEAIILIGYTESMTEAFETANPGLARRFPLYQAFSFTNYSGKDLADILDLKLRKRSLTPSVKGFQEAKTLLDIARHRPNFGNGGDVENLIELAISRRNARCAALGIDEDLDLDLLPQDFDPDFERVMEADQRCVTVFEELQGMEDIMRQFQQYSVMATRLRKRGHDPRKYIPWALVFRGPPGTGKTTMARQISKIYYNMGFLSAAELIECSVADLTSSYVGGSGKKVIRMFERALGKVLFIDEAYRLAENDATDAIGEMVDCMTKEKFFGNLVVVLAGYKEDMEGLMQRNRGLRSRFATHVDFHPMKPPDNLKLLQKHLAAVDIELRGIDPGSRSLESILGVLSKLARMKSWANGRDVIAFARTVIEHAYTSDKPEIGGLNSRQKLVIQANELLILLNEKLRRATNEGGVMGTSREPESHGVQNELRDRDDERVVEVDSEESSDDEIDDFAKDDESLDASLAQSSKSDGSILPRNIDSSNFDPHGEMWDVTLVLKISKLNLLGVKHGRNFEDTGSRAELELAIKYNQQALEAAPVSYPDRPAFLNNLGYMLGRRYEALGAKKDSRRALKLCGQAIKAAPLNHPDRGLWLRNLGYTLGTQFMQTGDIEALNRAIKFSEESVATADHDDPNVGDWLSSLGIWLFRRFELLGIMHDLDRAIAVCEKGVAMPTPSHHARAARLGNLTNCYGGKFERTGLRAPLDRAIESIEEAIGLLSDAHPHRPGCLIQLANMLQRRASLTGDKADLDRSITATEEALSIVPAHYPDRAGWLSNLGVNLGSRFKKTGAIADLNRAVEVSEEGVAAMPHGHHDRARSLNILGNRLWERSSTTGSSDDLEQALLRYKEGWNAPNTAPTQRIKLAKNAANILVIQSKWEESSSILEGAVKLLPLLSPRLLYQTDKQHMLSEFAGLASLAAATALIADKEPKHALQLLELGRGVIAGLFMEIRGNISDLEQQHPDLAKSFTSLRDELDTPAERTPSLAGVGSSTLSFISWESRARRRLEADKEFGRLLIKIRSQPGFENFLLPPSAEEMKAAANPHPIIVVNSSQFRCDAFLVEHDRIRVLNLPSLTLRRVEAKARGLRLSGLAATSQIAPLLQWLWDSVARPCLDALGLEKSVTDGNWPHIWWVPTGLLSQLPLHAAGYHDKGSTNSVLDRAISSYASSVKSLFEYRRRRGIVTHKAATQDRQSNQALLIGMSETSGLPTSGSLPFVKTEIEKVIDLCKLLQLEPVVPQRRKQNVLKHIETCKIFHFAGHGKSDSSEPSRSSLLLEDWEANPLTVGDLLDCKLQETPPFLAYLSACSTGANEAEKLADEGIHLVNAFQLAGFRHVVGTLWEVSDQHCVAVARTLYETMGGDREGMTDKAVALGLHRALRALRSGQIDMDGEARDAKFVGFGTGKREAVNFYWVPYVHFGV